MSDYSDEVFRTRAIAPDVVDERGYRRYGEGDLVPLFEADPRYADGPFKWPDGKPDTLRAWAGRQTRQGKRSGWVMPKHALPGSAFDAPLAQLRPDVPVFKRSWKHSHADEPPGELATHLRSDKRAAEHAALDLPSEVHVHRDYAKYLLPPGPHGKRWDTHPRCTPDRFRAAERVFLHLEGTLKLDALVSAGEVGADVPSVTLWDRAGAMSWLDWPGGKPSSGPTSADFWEFAAELERVRELQEDELLRFLREHVRAPVIVVCDRDWQDNPLVALEAFSLRDAVRDAGLECAVAAPPGKSKGSDDFQYRGGKPDNLSVIEPQPHRASGRAVFEREYRRTRREAGASGRKRSPNIVDRELALLDWYATHGTAQGSVRRPVGRIAKRLGVSKDTVKRGTLELQEAGALVIEGHYHDPDKEYDVPEDRAARRRKPTPATIRLREGLRAPLWQPSVGRWLRSLG
jgi:hypothetical protein